MAATTLPDDFVLEYDLLQLVDDLPSASSVAAAPAFSAVDVDDLLGNSSVAGIDPPAEAANADCHNPMTCHAAAAASLALGSSSADADSLLNVTAGFGVAHPIDDELSDLIISGADFLDEMDKVVRLDAAGADDVSCLHVNTPSSPESSASGGGGGGGFHDDLDDLGALTDGDVMSSPCPSSCPSNSCSTPRLQSELDDLQGSFLEDQTLWGEQQQQLQQQTPDQLLLQHQQLLMMLPPPEQPSQLFSGMSFSHNMLHALAQQQQQLQQQQQQQQQQLQHQQQQQKQQQQLQHQLQHQQQQQLQQQLQQQQQHYHHQQQQQQQRDQLAQAIDLTTTEEETEEDVDADMDDAKAKNDSELLVKEAKYLEAQYDYLLSRAKSSRPQRASVKGKRGRQGEKTALVKSTQDRKILNELVTQQQVYLENFKAMLSFAPVNDVRLALMTPMESYIHLGRDFDERRRTILSLREEKLDMTLKYIEQKAQGLSAHQPYQYSDMFEKFGKNYCVNFAISKYEDVSVLAVAGAIYEQIAGKDEDLTSKMGCLTVRESYDQIRCNFMHQRIVSSMRWDDDEAVAMPDVESNAIFYNRIENNVAVMATDYIDQDDLHPYQGSDRIRKDVSSGVVLTGHVDAATGKPYVVMKRFLMAKFHMYPHKISQEHKDKFFAKMPLCNDKMRTLIVDKLARKDGDDSGAFARCSGVDHHSV